MIARAIWGSWLAEEATNWAIWQRWLHRHGLGYFAAESRSRRHLPCAAAAGQLPLFARTA